MGSICIAMSILGILISNVIAGLFVAGMIFTMKVEIIASVVSLLNGQKGKRESAKSETCKELIDFPNNMVALKTWYCPDQLSEKKLLFIIIDSFWKQIGLTFVHCSRRNLMNNQLITLLQTAPIV